MLLKQEIITFLEAYKDKAEWRWDLHTANILQGTWNLYEATGEALCLGVVKSAMDSLTENLEACLKENQDLSVLGSARLLFELNRKEPEEKYETAIRFFWNYMMKLDKTSTNVIWHLTREPSDEWLGGLYLAGAFYLEYENDFHEKAGYQDVQMWFKQVKSQVVDADIKPSKDAMGLYLMALIDCCPLVSEEVFDHYKNLEAMFKNGLKEMLSEKSPQVAYLLLKGCRMGILQKEKYLKTGMELAASIELLPQKETGIALLAYGEYLRGEGL